MAESQSIMPHKVTLQERQQLSLTGVSEIVSFDEASVVLHTQKGTLTVHGKELQLKTLSPQGGQVEVAGTVTALVYEEPRPAGGWLRRLFG